MNAALFSSYSADCTKSADKVALIRRFQLARRGVNVTLFYRYKQMVPPAHPSLTLTMSNLSIVAYSIVSRTSSSTTRTIHACDAPLPSVKKGDHRLPRRSRRRQSVPGKGDNPLSHAGGREKALEVQDGRGALEPTPRPGSRELVERSALLEGYGRSRGEPSVIPS